MIKKPADYDPKRDGTAFFGWDDDSYPCHPCGTTWNGFDNVRVSPAVRDLIVADFAAMAGDADAVEDNDTMAAIEPDADGLIDLSNGYATQLDPDADESEPPRALSFAASDWELIADAISNSDMPSDDRLRLLDRLQ